MGKRIKKQKKVTVPLTDMYKAEYCKECKRVTLHSTFGFCTVCWHEGA